MAIPEGYQFLAKLGIVYKGDYDERVTYNQYDAVYYNGSTYIALVDSQAGPPTADGVNWQYMAQGFLSQVISSLTATDKNGVIGEAGATVNAQELINGISDDLKDKLDKTGDASDTIVTFEQASERTNIISGESHKTIFGKIKKWFADMTAAAFAQIITSNTDLMATTVEGYLVDALAVKQQFDVVNSNLSTVVLPITSIDNAIVAMSEWSEFTYNDFMATLSLYAIMSVDGTNSIVNFGSENAPKRTTILNVQKLSGKSTSVHAYIDTNGLLIVGGASANDYLLITGTWFKK